MKKMIRAMLWWDEAKQALSNQKGQGMVEYGLILALIAVVAAVALTPLGTQVASKFTSITTSLTP